MLQVLIEDFAMTELDNSCRVVTVSLKTFRSSPKRVNRNITYFLRAFRLRDGFNYRCCQTKDGQWVPLQTEFGKFNEHTVFTNKAFGKLKHKFVKGTREEIVMVA